MSSGGLAIALAGSADEPRARPVLPPAPGRFDVELDVVEFHKGNLHTHSLVSDGDAAPVDVYRWYRRQGYQFVALTDHNARVEPKVYAHLERRGFKILAGEEITMKGGGKEVHVNGLCTVKKIGGGNFATRPEALVHAISSIEAQGGVALINHPNFDWSLEEEDVFAGRAAPLLEIWSGHPYVWSLGVGDRPSHEVLWSRLLDRGAQFSAVAVDDSHHYGSNPAPKKAAVPGRGWVGVYASPGQDVERGATCDALRQGRFIASSGARLDRLRVAQGTISVWPSDAEATVSFLGRGGEVLASMRPGREGASFTLRGGEAWIRVRVDQPDGKQAWTQPFRAKAPTEGATDG